MKLRALFVYGTLRVGEGNYPLLRGAVERYEEDATIQGDLFFVSGPGSYPVADLDGKETITGDVLWVHPKHEGVQRADAMERGAGYEVREVKATLPGGETILVTAYHYLNRWDRRGEQIKDGDWRRAVNEWEANHDRD